jgi:hypothetical protein
LKTKLLPGKVTLCEIHDRYQKALRQLKSQGIQEPEHIANLYAPRFINMPDWLKDREKNNYDPVGLYSPAPLTWRKWEAGAKVLQTVETANYKLGKVQMLAFGDLFNVHQAALQGLGGPAGKFRKVGEIGRVMSKDWAIQKSEANNLRQNEYRSFRNPFRKIVSWRPTECLEDRDLAFRKYFEESLRQNKSLDFREWPEQSSPHYFTSSEGAVRQCGLIQYAKPEEIEWQVKVWLLSFNGFIVGMNHKLALADMIEAAAKVQRWFISIHPFEDGNGRMSRFMMEYLFRSVGLPTPILMNFNDDLYKSETQWAQEIGKGLIEAVKITEACAANPAGKGCQPVSDGSF